VACLASPTCLKGQELEPRALTNVPVGSNFFIIGYGYSFGNILLDPALPIEDLDARLHAIPAGYLRAIDFFGFSGKVDVVVPFAAGDWTGTIEDQDEAVSLMGFGDPRVRLSVNFLGAPALRADEYKGYRQKTIVGGSLQVIVPLGQYDSSELINLGSNRWIFRPQLGASHAFEKWFVEVYSGLWLFTKNPDFFGGSELTQRPMLTFKLHAIRTIWRGMWLALGAGYGVGGKTFIDGVPKDTHISTLRLGATLSVPLAARHSIKLNYTTGIRFERGPDFDAIAVAYQYRWGGIF
jgi:hypothetical protein